MNSIVKFLQQFVGGLLWGIVFKIGLMIFAVMIISKIMNHVFKNVSGEDVKNLGKKLLSAGSIAATVI